MFSFSKALFGEAIRLDFSRVCRSQRPLRQAAWGAVHHDAKFWVIRLASILRSANFLLFTVALSTSLYMYFLRARSFIGMYMYSLSSNKQDQWPTKAHSRGCRWRGSHSGSTNSRNPDSGPLVSVSCGFSGLNAYIHQIYGNICYTLCDKYDEVKSFFTGVRLYNVRY